MAKGRVEINTEKCKGCEICITACKYDVLALSAPDKTNSSGYRYLVAIKPENCIGCGFCGQMCPDSAITIFREGKGAQ